MTAANEARVSFWLAAMSDWTPCASFHDATERIAMTVEWLTFLNGLPVVEGRNE